MLKNKNLILVVVVIVVIVLIIAAVVFFRQTSPAGGIPSAPQPSGTTETELFPSGEGGTNHADLVPGKATGEGGGADTNLSTFSGGPLANFVKISSRPVAAVFTANQNNATSTNQIFYIERATGHIYKADPNEQVVSRISNTTIPKIYGALGSRGDSALHLVLNYIKDGRTQNFVASLPLQEDETGESFLEEDALPKLTGELLNPGISQFALSPQKDRLFYLREQLGQTLGTIADLDGKNPEVVFTSPLGEWWASWPGTGTVSLQTRASSQALGFLYFLNTKTGALQKIIGGVPGLSANVNPALNSVLYSGAGESGLVFGIYDVKQNIFLGLPPKTLAEKCVWSADSITAYCAVPSDLPKANYPDDWYAGKVSLADNIWRIDSESRRAEVIFNPQLANLGENIDATKLTLSPDESVLYLINKKDLSLWALNLLTSF